MRNYMEDKYGNDKYGIFRTEHTDRYHRYQLVKSMDEKSSRMTISNKLHSYILCLPFYRLICIKWTQQSDTYL